MKVPAVIVTVMLGLIASACTWTLVEVVNLKVDVARIGTTVDLLSKQVYEKNNDPAPVVARAPRDPRNGL